MFRTLMVAVSLALAAPALAEPPPRPPAEDLEPGWQERVRAREAEIMEYLAEQDPEAYERLKMARARARTPEEKMQYLYRLHQVSKRVKAREEDPERFARRQAMRDKERAIRDLAAGADTLPKAEAKARRAELEKLVAELFDLRQEERKARLAELQARLAELEAEITERDANRGTIIDEFVDGLMNPMPEL